MTTDASQDTLPRGRRLALPTYPFKRQKYCPEPGGETAPIAPIVPAGNHPPAPDPVPPAESAARRAADPAGARPTDSRRDHLVRAPALDIDPPLGRLEAALPALNGEPLPHPAASLSRSPAGLTVRPRDQKMADGKKLTFGSFRPIQQSDDRTLTREQRRHLTELIADYCARYPKSKAFTADHRAFFADPRAVAGFNPLWKEMVFPAVTEGSEGAYLWDIDGNRWLDVVQGFGLGLFGHRPRFVVEALRNQLDRGFEIGTTSPLAGEVAGLIRKFSGQERVAFCNTGSEALMAAIRVARTVTGRDKIAMFAGSYHGIFDEVLARPLAVNGELRAIPIAPGVPESAVSQVIVLEYDHPESLEIIKRHGHELAAVLVEPVPSRRPDIAPYEFVRQLREITQRSGSAMILDEVLLGFRSHPGGAQQLFGTKADLVSYGKVLGGGLPLGVLAGQRKFMDALDGGDWRYGDDSAPEVGVTFFAGTFVRHPLALAAARAVLRHLQDEGPALQQRMDEKTTAFAARLNGIFTDSCVPVTVTHFSSLWMLNPDPALKYFGLLFYHLRLRGLHIWEGRGNFLSTAHSDSDIEVILQTFAESIRALQEGGFLPEGRPDSVTTAPDSPRLAMERAPNAPAPELTPDPPRTRPESRRLSPEQRELFLFSKMSPEASVAAHQSVTLRLHGALEVAKLEQALHQLTARHASLRSCFARDGSRQIVAPALTIELRRATLPTIDELTSAECLEPFDLTRAPLWRTVLVEHAADDHSLLITAHHLICDSWSFAVIVHDLAALYRGVELPPISVPEAVIEHDPDAESYWQAEYATAPTALELPTDRPRVLQPDLRSSTLTGTFPTPLGGLLREFCRREKLTINAVLVTAWQILLHRLSGQSDVIVGTSVAGQSISGSADSVGHHVHFLPLRATVDPATPVRGLLSITRGKLADATDHQHFTLGQLCQSLALTRAPGRPSFVTNTFTIETAAPPMVMDDVQVTTVVNPKRRLAFDISLFVVESAEQLGWHLVYQEALFERQTVAHWMRCFGTIVESIITDPDRAVRDVPLLCEEDERLVLTEWSGVVLPGTATSGTVHGLFEEQADRHPRATALRLPSGSVTYQQLERRANQFAQELIGAGVRPGQAVALFAERSAETIASLLGILKAGGAYVPVDPAYPDERVAMMLGDLGVTVFVTQPALRARLESILRRTAPCIVDITPDAPHPWSDRGERPAVEHSPDALAYIISTSGSTGRPKGTMVPHRAVVRLVRDQSFATMSAAETWLQLAPLSFDACTLELWAPLLNGGKLALMPPGTPSLAEIGKAIRQHGVTSAWLTAGLFQLMVDERPDDLGSLRELLTGGDVVSLRHARIVLERFPHLRLINGYGPTENTTFTCCHTITAADLQGTSLPIGRPIARTTVYIVDDQGQPCPVGVTGELLAGGTGLALGYRRHDDLTQEKFTFHPRFGRVYRTGDRVRWRADGVIEFFGRADSQIKVRGFRIDPVEIESALALHPSVKQAVVIARGGSGGDKRLVAYCVENGQGFDPRSVRDHLERLLPDYMVPQVLLPIPNPLPLEPNGKVDVSRLPDLGDAVADDRAGGDPDVIAPRDAVERRLHRLMEETLGRNSFGVRDDFFALGGDSLQGLRFFTRIEREFGRSLSLGSLFQAPTVEKLAHLVREVRMDLPRHVIAIQPKGTQRPIFLIHGADGGVLFYRKAVRQLGEDQPVFGIEAPMLTDSSILSPGATVEEIAARYLELVKRVQGQGPYRLGGYSFGGIVAYEMARQLRAGGESVEHLWLFDTDNPAVSPRYFSAMGRVRARWQIDGEEGLTGSKRLKSLAVRFRQGLVELKQRRLETAAIDAAVRSGQRARSDLRPVEVRELHHKLMEAYRPERFDGSMTLLRCSGANDKFEHTPALGWEDLVRGHLEVIGVTGTHPALFDEPHVTVVATKLAACLSREPVPAATP